MRSDEPVEECQDEKREIHQRVEAATRVRRNAFERIAFLHDVTGIVDREEVSQDEDDEQDAADV